MIVGVHHIAVGVDDFGKALDFYTKALGFSIESEAEFDNVEKVDQAIGLKQARAKTAMLKAGNVFLELWHYSRPEPRDLRSRACDFGYPHFALQVDDITTEYDRLKSFGMEFVGDIVHFDEKSSAIYGRDPCGNLIEIYEIKNSETPQLDRNKLGLALSNGN